MTTPKKKPLRQSARKPQVTQSSPAIERIIAQLRRKGCRFPISRRELSLKYHGLAGPATFRELVRRGMILCSEAWDGSLSDMTADVLEGEGITSRADFRRRYQARELPIHRWRCFGKFKQAQLLAWAGLPPPDDVLHEVRLHLDTNTCQELEALVKLNRFRSRNKRDKVVARLVSMDWACHCARQRM
jgi:hypothetical protein